MYSRLSILRWWLTLFPGAFQGLSDQISRREFAYALAGLFASIAVGLGFAFGLIHVLPVVLTLWRARRLVTAAQGAIQANRRARCFAVNFNGTRQELERNWLIGHDWINFEETLFDTDSGKAIGNTVRPQAFFNSGIARERLSGLKMMNAVPGYFVGIGLLLTFIGLVSRCTRQVPQRRPEMPSGWPVRWVSCCRSQPLSSDLDCWARRLNIPFTALPLVLHSNRRCF